MADQTTKLVLGTVQLGMKYGLNNTVGQPTEGEAFAILDSAWRSGIDTFDTAAAYGNSEEVLGSWLGTSKGKAFVVTKFKPNILDEYPGIPVKEAIRTELQKSLERLRLEKIDGYLLHTPKYLYVDGVIEGLRAVRDEGLVDHIGVSTYDEEDALNAIDLGVEYIQVPYNALDQRLDRTDFFKKTENRGVKVFARSPYLQGLLIMEPSLIPSNLEHARAHVERFRQIAERHALTPAEAAIVFVLEQPHIQHVVFGVETLPQLESGIATSGKADGSHDDFVRDVVGAFKNMDRAVVNPSLWKR